MNWSVSLLITTVLAFSNTALAGEPGANYPHLKHLERIIGHWKYVGQDEQGRAVQGEETMRWIFNKNYLRGEGIWQIEGGKPISYELTTGWDPELKQVVMNGALSNGLVFRRIGHFDKKQNASVSTQTNIAPDGTKDTMQCIIKYGDKDSWSGSWTDHTTDGEPLPDSSIEATRVVEEMKLPKDVMKELNAMVGDWKITGQASEGELEGIWSLRWARGGHCLTTDYSLSVGGEHFQASEICGWDAITKEFVLFSIYQGGHIELSRTKLIAPGVQRGPYSVDIKGKQYEGTIESRRKGDNEFRVITQGLAAQGIDDLDLRAVRIVTDNGMEETKSAKGRGTAKQKKKQQPKKEATKPAVSAKAEIQKFWESIVGTWAVNADEPNFAIEKRALDRYLIRSPGMDAIIQWDTKDKKWKQHSFTERGQSLTTFDFVDGHVVAKSTGHDRKSGGMETGSWKFTAIDQDQYELNVGNIVKDGEKQPDRAFVVKRHAGTALTSDKTATRKEFAEFCRMMKGRWINNNEVVASWVDFETTGDNVVSYGTTNLAADGKALASDWYAGNGTGHCVTYWDPVAKQIKGLGVMSDGTIWQEVRYKEDGKWQQVVTLNHPDGLQDTRRSTLTISDEGDTHTYENSGDSPKGVYRRVAK